MPEHEDATRAAVWNDYWRDAAPNLAEWDVLSNLILMNLYREGGALGQGCVLEAGCGSGRISRRLAAQADLTVLLDISASALKLARTLAGSCKSLRLVRGSILQIPFGRCFDMIWNAGVVEHFSPREQATLLQELASTLKPGGRVIVFSPYAGSALYRLGKFLLEKTGRWRYGVEQPVRSLRAVCPAALQVEREYTIAALPFLLDAYKFMPVLTPLCRVASVLLGRFLPEEAIRLIDRSLAKITGGYLLVTVMRESQTG